MTASERRAVVTRITAAQGVSERRALRFTGFPRTTVRYRCRRPEQTLLRERRFACHPRWNGCQQISGPTTGGTSSRETYYRWKQKFGGMGLSEARRLKQLEEENQRLKRIVADQAVNLQVLKDLLGNGS